jgi:very-short-patch-repair endonuclease
MGHQDRTVEEVLGRLAFSAHGLVKRRQLLDAEITAKQIRSRIDKRMLLVEYPGVYRVGHRAPSLEATYLAAVWACGDDALLSGRAAGYLLELLRGAPSPPEVIAPTERRVGGVITHRFRVLHPTEAMKWRKVPVTSFGRTLVDLAAVLTVNELARACHEAGVKHRVTPAQVEAVLSRRLNAPGAGKLREILRGDARVRLSELESAFLSLLREDDLPLPKTNRPAGGRRVDCRWPEHRVTVELDSYRYHNSRRSWEADRRREREAYARGDQFRRYTWGDVFEEPRFMRAELRELLSNPT